MTAEVDGRGHRALPARPNIEHLRNKAKQRLLDLRTVDPTAKLADAQLALARECGFASWRALKAEVERRTAGDLSRYVGRYRGNLRTDSGALLTVSEADGRLYGKWLGRARLPLNSLGAGVFETPGLENVFCFDKGHGPVAGLVLRDDFGDMHMERASIRDAEQARAALAAALADQTRPRETVSVPRRILMRYMGFYAIGRGPALRLWIEDDQLVALLPGSIRLRLYPSSETAFFALGIATQLSFDLADRGIVRADWRQEGRTQILRPCSAHEAARINAPIEARAADQRRPRVVAAIHPSTLSGYVGTYRLDDRTALAISRTDASLFAQFTGQPRQEIHPEGKDRFFWTGTPAQLAFVADREGQVSSAVLHQHGRRTSLAKES